MGFLSDLFGSKPKVPELKKLDLGDEQAQAVQNNLDIVPDASKLARLTHDELLSMIKTTFPNFDAVSGKITQNIEDQVSGKIPDDVQKAVQNNAAAKSLLSGTSGSQFAGNLLARDLGLTSLELTNRGLASAERWLAASEQLASPAAQVFTGMFVTPGQQASFDVNERNLKFQRDWMKNQISAMPDPVTVGLWNTGWSVVDAVLSAYTGSSVELGLVDPQGSTGGLQGMSWGGGWGGGGGGGASYVGGGGGYSAPSYSSGGSVQTDSIDSMMGF